MESRVIALERQLHQLSQQQVALTSLLSRFALVVPSLARHGEKLLGGWESNIVQVDESLSSLKLEQEEKKQISSVIREIEFTSPATPPLSEISTIESPRPETPVQDLDQLASDILDIIQGYSQHLPSADNEGETGHSQKWLGKGLFMDKVKAQLENNQAIRLILPAFPWKSVNKVDKVTGILPDLGEELALYRLNQMCEDIRAVYPLGGQVHIATDGLVFDDVVGIPDEDTWAYGEGLLAMAREHNLKNIRLMRVMDIFGYTEGKTLDQELYLSLAESCRKEILAKYGRTEEEVRQMMKDDPDTLLTYRGFIHFLEADLKYSPVTAATKAISGNQYRKTVKKVAIQMMIRAESFTKLLQARCADYVRLSIHPSTGAVKLSVPLVVQGSGAFPRSPWHSSLAMAVDGSYSTVPARDVRETHDLILQDGRGYYFREKSDVWDLQSADSEHDVVVLPRYPNRLVVKPARAELYGIQKLSAGQMDKLAALRAAHTAGPVQLMSFAGEA